MFATEYVKENTVHRMRQIFIPSAQHK